MDLMKVLDTYCENEAGEDAAHTICTHEAGHVVTAFASGFELGPVTFLRDRDGWRGEFRAYSRGPAGFRTIRNNIVIALSGAAAEAVLLDGAQISSSTDYRRAAESAKALIASGLEPGQLWKEVGVTPSHSLPDIPVRAPKKVREILAFGWLEAERILGLWKSALYNLTKSLEGGFENSEDSAQITFEHPVLLRSIETAMGLTSEGRALLRTVPREK